MKRSFAICLLVVCAILTLGCGKSRSQRSVTIEVGTYYADKVWCESGEVEQDTQAPNAQAKWFTAWTSLPCDTKGRDYQFTECLTVIPENRSLRFQCFAKFGDTILNTCPDVDKGSHIVRTKVERGYLVVENTCQIN